MSVDKIKIPLPSGHHAVIDKEDLFLLKNYKWFRAHQRRGRVSAVMCTAKDSVKRVDIYLHHIILREKKVGLQIDHVDRNPLNNSKKNLRWVTQAQNSRNWLRKTKNQTSKYRGVEKRRTWWVARIFYKNKSEIIGKFKTEIEAARAYDKKSLEYFGEYGWINLQESRKH